jgi:hypothetical protein
VSKSGIRIFDGEDDGAAGLIEALHHFAELLRKVVRGSMSLVMSMWDAMRCASALEVFNRTF